MFMSLNTQWHGEPPCLPHAWTLPLLVHSCCAGEQLSGQVTSEAPRLSLKIIVYAWTRQLWPGSSLRTECDWKARWSNESYEKPAYSRHWSYCNLRQLLLTHWLYIVIKYVVNSPNRTQQSIPSQVLKSNSCVISTEYPGFRLGLC